MISGACKNVPFHSSCLMNKLCMVCAIGEILRKTCYGCTFCIDFLTVKQQSSINALCCMRATRGGGALQKKA